LITTEDPAQKLTLLGTVGGAGKMGTLMVAEVVVGHALEAVTVTQPPHGTVDATIALVPIPLISVHPLGSDHKYCVALATGFTLKFIIVPPALLVIIGEGVAGAGITVAVNDAVALQPNALVPVTEYVPGETVMDDVVLPLLHA
jgi:hypothetical protein